MPQQKDSSGLERIVQKGLNFVKENKNYLIAASFFTLANLADTVTTSYAVNSGLQEGAPLMKYFVETYGLNNAGIIKMGLGLGVVGLLYPLKGRTRISYAAGIGITGLAAWNSFALFYYG